MTGVAYFAIVKEVGLWYNVYVGEEDPSLHSG